MPAKNKNSVKPCKLRDRLAAQEAITEENIPRAIIEIQNMKNRAEAQKMFREADSLDALRSRYVFHLVELNRSAIKIIDDSEEIKEGIKLFAEINADLTSLTDEIKDINKFLDTATKVAKTLDKAIKFLA